MGRGKLGVCVCVFFPFHCVFGACFRVFCSCFLSRGFFKNETKNSRNDRSGGGSEVGGGGRILFSIISLAVLFGFGFSDCFILV